MLDRQLWTLNLSLYLLGYIIWNDVWFSFWQYMWCECSVGSACVMDSWVVGLCKHIYKPTAKLWTIDQWKAPSESFCARSGFAFIWGAEIMVDWRPRTIHPNWSNKSERAPCCHGIQLASLNDAFIHVWSFDCLIKTKLDIHSEIFESNFPRSKRRPCCGIIQLRLEVLRSL